MPPSPDALVRRGRMIYLGIILFVILAEVGMSFFLNEEPSPIRLGLAVGLFAAAWYGFDWAILLLAFGFATGVLVAISATVLALMAGAELAFFLSLTVGVAYAAIVVALIRSRSLNAFFKFQSQLRRAEAPGQGEDSAGVDPVLGDADRLVTIATYNLPDIAQAEMLLLEQEGVCAFLTDANLVETDWFVSNVVAGAKIEVAEADADRALEILQQYRAAEAQAGRSEEPVVFDCPECGQDVMFPADRRGRVETCPHCGGYVDVPE